MDQTKLNNAKSEFAKAFKWLVKSGVLMTALNATLVALNALQSGQIDIKVFLTGEIYILSFMLVNGAIYFVGQYKIPEN